MSLITFDYFSKFLTNTSTVNHFQMFKPGSVNDRCEALQIQTRDPIKSIRRASNFTKWPGLEMVKEDTAHQNTQSNNMNIVHHIAYKLFMENIQI